MSDLLPYKKRLLERCRALLAEQIQAAKEELKKLQELEQEETKSSAGDKYETGRAMLFLEKEKISIRLSEIYKKDQALGRFNFERRNASVEPGTLIKTDQGYYLLAVALGEIDPEPSCYAISPVSPLGKVFLGRRFGDAVDFNGKFYRILEVC